MIPHIIKSSIISSIFGSWSWARTNDLLINSQLLYLLSYPGIIKNWWRDRDSNPGYPIKVCWFSRPVHSTTLPSLLKRTKGTHRSVPLYGYLFIQPFSTVIICSTVVARSMSKPLPKSIRYWCFSSNVKRVWSMSMCLTIS